ATAWACGTPVMSTMSLAACAALPTSGWMRMYAVTTDPDLLASCRPRRPAEPGAEGMVACGGQVRRSHGCRMESADREETIHRLGEAAADLGQHTSKAGMAARPCWPPGTS